MTFDDLNPELREKARACKTPEELAKLAEDEGIKLTDEELAAISGGGPWGGCDDDICEVFAGCNRF